MSEKNESYRSSSFCHATPHYAFFAFFYVFQIALMSLFAVLNCVHIIQIPPSLCVSKRNLSALYPPICEPSFHGEWGCLCCLSTMNLEGFFFLQENPMRSKNLTGILWGSPWIFIWIRFTWGVGEWEERFCRYVM